MATDAFKDEMKRLMAAVSHNPAQVEFPQDAWGMTSELRKVALRTAAAIRGDENKLQIFLGSLQIIAGHAKARMQADKDYIAERLAAAQVLAGKERVYGNPVPATATEQAVPTVE
jgi:hypothetical protein